MLQKDTCMSNAPKHTHAVFLEQTTYGSLNSSLEFQRVLPCVTSFAAQTRTDYNKVTT